ncbi:MAG: sulfopropanediol 3-dehydrogenase [Thermoleophilaceae bacterium]|jgi:sulfopropanediol 3-dehydrogenase|nr:sulfopropanediol 3-dehydrogenase [Thermoleophilaceae bacterium]
MARCLKDAPSPRTSASEEVERTVSEMLKRIGSGGARAIRDYSRMLDGWDPPSFRVGAREIADAESRVSDELKQHITFAQEQVRGFARAQRDTLCDLEVETLPGVVLGHRHIPVDAVGSYVPGGRYPMLASSFMTVVVPKVAGVGRVVACAPPFRGEGIHPAMLYAMSTSGADEIVCLGGVQGLAALAFGLDGEIEPVDMIVGAGNAYVAEAKRQLFGEVGIDLLAGPTEILVVADDGADPDIVAADLLGQAEHGPTSQAVFISTSRRLAEAVLQRLDALLETWPTAETAGKAWADYGIAVVAEGDEEAIELVNAYASEHLEVHVRPDRLDDWFAQLRNYGSLFLGDQATVVYGDKAIGTNHVLPTSRAARYTGGLWVGKFLKTCTYQRLTEEGTRLVAPAAAAISDAEMMAGHAITARMRLDRLVRGAE